MSCKTLLIAVGPEPAMKPVWQRSDPVQAAHLKNLHEGQEAVLKRPLVVVVEDKRLQQLQDGEHVAEERHVVLLPELQQVEVDAPVQEARDHRQVSGEGRTGDGRAVSGPD